MRKLDVYFETTFLGVLHEEKNIWGFKYNAHWLESPDVFNVITHLNLNPDMQWDGSTSRPVQWFFDNLMPEEQARVLLEKDTGVAPGDTFALLQAVGHESAGALTIMESGKTLSSGAYEPVTEDDLNKRIINLPTTPMNERNRKRMSLAGAQHKMLVIYTDDKKLFEPTGNMPSSHILKPEHSMPDVYMFTCRNEWFSMKLAKLCNLPVPPVDVIYVPEAAYIIKRFDRVGEFPHQSRIHMMDGCQILNYPASQKYSANTASTLFELTTLCRKRAQTQQLLFRWALFNAVIGNSDAHLKNLSFKVGPEGVELMPHYDLVSTEIYDQNNQLSQPMGDAKYFNELNRENLMDFAKELKIGAALAKRELTTMLTAVRAHADNLIEEVVNQEVHSGKAGELMMLRKIRYIAIEDMCRQLEF